MTDPSLLQLFMGLAALAAGLAAGLAIWLVSQLIAALPTEDRSFRDTPPLGFRLAWWPIRWVAHFTGAMMPEAIRLRTFTELRRGGLDFSLTAEQFVAARLVSGITCATLLGAWLQPLLSGDASPGVTLGAAVAAFLFGVAWPALWLRDRVAVRRRELLKSLPFFLDIITLCVEAGLNLQGALQQAVVKAPAGVLRDEIQRALRDMRAGMTRAAALRALADRLQEGAVNSFVASVIQAESMGMNLGPVLRAQAEQRRSERFLRAEKLAMQAPVKMLLPLIGFIFPCTFIVLFFPIAMKFLHSGL